MISSVVRQPLQANWPANHAHSTCRLTLAEHGENATIHVDPNSLSGILYLSRPEDCRGGTEFYRHLRTGTDRMPMDPEGLKALGFEIPYAELEQDILKEGGDRSKWEQTMMIPMRFNRLVLLQPQYWHTAGRWASATMYENGRLCLSHFLPARLSAVDGRTSLAHWPSVRPQSILILRAFASALCVTL